MEGDKKERVAVVRWQGKGGEEGGEEGGATVGSEAHLQFKTRFGIMKM